MGCDIHMHVEYKITRKDDAVWRCGDYFKIDNPLSRDTQVTHMDLYGDRDYDLFAVLANVRNYNHVDYIAEPKGLPDDVTEYVRQEYCRWGCDAHSCSYFTLRELIDYHVEHVPQDIFGDDILKPLIDRLKQRADELNVLWDFEWNNSVTHEKADNIRIIFWFDN